MIASTILFVPVAKLGFSATPTVPFQRTVSDSDIILLKRSIDFTPMSSQIILLGMLLASAVQISPEPNFLNSPLKSTGRTILVFFLLALLINIEAVSILSPSIKERPISLPILAINVFAIAPPIIILSANPKKFSITPIFVSIFAPPIIKVKGWLGL